MAQDKVKETVSESDRQGKGIYAAPRAIADLGAKIASRNRRARRRLEGRGPADAVADQLGQGRRS